MRCRSRNLEIAVEKLLGERSIIDILEQYERENPKTSSRMPQREPSDEYSGII